MPGSACGVACSLCCNTHVCLYELITVRGQWALLGACSHTFPCCHAAVTCAGQHTVCSCQLLYPGGLNWASGCGEVHGHPQNPYLGVSMLHLETHMGVQDRVLQAGWFHRPGGSLILLAIAPVCKCTLAICVSDSSLQGRHDACVRHACASILIQGTTSPAPGTAAPCELLRHRCSVPVHSPMLLLMLLLVWRRCWQQWRCRRWCRQ